MGLSVTMAGAKSFITFGSIEEKILSGTTKSK
jgi:hypothetical protein